MAKLNKTQERLVLMLLTSAMELLDTQLPQHLTSPKPSPRNLNQ